MLSFDYIVASNSFLIVESGPRKRASNDSVPVPKVLAYRVANMLCKHTYIYICIGTIYIQYICIYIL